jgi:predicted 3-demethylubiquinone-9 3-methyltransferase (glyoxalase superfamily)
MKKLIPHLWFDDQAEEAVRFYTDIFPKSKVHHTVRYPEAAQEVSGRPAGSVMTIDFELDGQPFVALNGGPEFKFNEAISFLIPCKDQKEIDYFWTRLTDGGEESVCGWLKDRFGISWQVVPEHLSDMMKDDDQGKVEAVTASFMKMRKLDVKELEQAYKAA